MCDPVVAGTVEQEDHPKWVSPGATIRSEVQLSLPAGSTLLLDSRLWWSPVQHEPHDGQVMAVASYAPWWLCTDFGGRNQAEIDAESYMALSAEMQLLVRHRATGQADSLQTPKLEAAARALLPNAAPRRSNAWIRVAHDAEAYDSPLVVGTRNETLESVHAQFLDHASLGTSRL